MWWCPAWSCCMWLAARWQVDCSLFIVQVFLFISADVKATDTAALSQDSTLVLPDVPAVPAPAPAIRYHSIQTYRSCYTKTCWKINKTCDLLTKNREVCYFQIFTQNAYHFNLYKYFQTKEWFQIKYVSGSNSKSYHSLTKIYLFQTQINQKGIKALLKVNFLTYGYKRKIRFNLSSHDFKTH